MGARACARALGESLGPGSSGSPSAPGPPGACPVDRSSSHAGLAAHLAAGALGPRLGAGAASARRSAPPSWPRPPGVPCALPPPRGHQRRGLPLAPPRPPLVGGVWAEDGPPCPREGLAGAWVSGEPCPAV
ncbi:unnamed protein product [Rangifer tarandus platyrhynchus]|uniref:Uncharacterized protein n=1 Tax=Rangifer tarandus platyrhynchus TaxID=3082113 RepID=A0ABN8Z350_RANTA|nr:unnamed protein product [Rangifer tarandus platyrhynchus]